MHHKVIIGMQMAGNRVGVGLALLELELAQRHRECHHIQLVLVVTQQCVVMTDVVTLVNGGPVGMEEHSLALGVLDLQIHTIQVEVTLDSAVEQTVVAFHAVDHFTLGSIHLAGHQLDAGDGPRAHTQRLLDILEQYNAKATFFVVNTQYKMKTLLPAIVNAGHGIGMHSVSHEYSEIYASEEAFFKDLYAMQKIIKDATGVTTTMMRFPGGSSNNISKQYNVGIMTRLTKAVTDQGFQYYDWNVSSGDAGGVSGSKAEKTAQVVSNVIKGISGKQYAIVLQHDIQDFSVDAVEQILVWGLNNGYTFQALTPSSPTCHHKVNN